MLFREHGEDQGIPQAPIRADLRVLEFPFQPEPGAFGHPDAATIQGVAPDLQPPRLCSPVRRRTCGASSRSRPSASTSLCGAGCCFPPVCSYPSGRGTSSCRTAPETRPTRAARSPRSPRPPCGSPPTASRVSAHRTTPGPPRRAPGRRRSADSGRVAVPSRSGRESPSEWAVLHAPYTFHSSTVRCGRRSAGGGTDVFFVIPGREIGPSRRKIVRPSGFRSVHNGQRAGARCFLDRRPKTARTRVGILRAVASRMTEKAGLTERFRKGMRVVSQTVWWILDMVSPSRLQSR